MDPELGDVGGSDQEFGRAIAGSATMTGLGPSPKIQMRIFCMTTWVIVSNATRMCFGPRVRSPGRVRTSEN